MMSVLRNDELQCNVIEFTCLKVSEQFCIVTTPVDP